MRETTTPPLVSSAGHRNATELLMQRFRTSPGHVAFEVRAADAPVTDPWRQVTTGQFVDEVRALAKGFIAAGLGVTLLPDLALATLRSDVVVRATDPPAPNRRVWAATRAEGSRSPATDEMLSILVEVGAAYEKRTGELTLVA